MKNVLLIKPDEIKIESVIEKNVDEKLLGKIIQNVQEIQLRPILGTTLYDTVIDTWNSLAIALAADANYVWVNTNKELIIDYIRPFLTHAVVVDFIVISSFKLSNKGLLKLNDNSANNVNSIDTEYLKNYYDNYFATYKKRLIDFVKTQSPQPIDTIDRNTTSEAIGWFLESDYGECGYYSTYYSRYNRYGYYF